MQSDPPRTPIRIAPPLHRRSSPVGLMFRGLLLVALGIACVEEVAACPPGTRFSAYQGNGICVILGQGAKAAAQCQVASGPCPSGTSREHSNNDPSRDY